MILKFKHSVVFVVMMVVMSFTNLFFIESDYILFKENNILNVSGMIFVVASIFTIYILAFVIVKIANDNGLMQPEYSKDGELL